ncbi:MAG TPA: alanine racemase [Bacteroides sp.]|nr:alanine racemase [Bacteroides sp.]
MASTSRIIIRKDALKHNVRFIRSVVNPDTVISAVIKGNAYGHGVSVIIPALEELGIHHFSVYSSAEAREACQHRGKHTTIMVMGFIDEGDLEWIIRNEIEFYVSHPLQLEQALTKARSMHKDARIHLDIETGMYRTGLTLPQLKQAAVVINRNRDFLTIRGAASHFAGAESIANHMRIKKQYAVFNKRIRMLQESGIHPETKHIASSAAMINYPETQMDLVRTGVLIYGYWPTKETFIHYTHRRKDKTDPLRRALSWVTRVMLTKDIPEGEFIGYGLNYQAQQKMRIMVLPVGYCNGYSRSLSNNGHVIVRGMRSPVIGMVNMNMIICDITDNPAVRPGDEVTLIGRQGDAEISFSSFAEMNNSLNYEILARLPDNIDRIILNN